MSNFQRNPGSSQVVANGFTTNFMLNTTDEGMYQVGYVKGENDIELFVRISRPTGAAAFRTRCCRARVSRHAATALDLLRFHHVAGEHETAHPSPASCNSDVKESFARWGVGIVLK